MSAPTATTPTMPLTGAWTVARSRLVRWRREPAPVPDGADTPAMPRTALARSRPVCWFPEPSAAPEGAAA